MDELKQEPTTTPAEPTMSELMEVIKRQQAQINILTKVVGKGSEQKAAAEEAKIPAIPKETVKRGDKEYKFAAAVFVLAGHGKVTAEEALHDKGILDAIFDMPGQGILKEVF